MMIPWVYLLTGVAAVGATISTFYYDLFSGNFPIVGIITIGSALVLMIIAGLISRQSLKGGSLIALACSLILSFVGVVSLIEEGPFVADVILSLAGLVALGVSVVALLPRRRQPRVFSLGHTSATSSLLHLAATGVATLVLIGGLSALFNRAVSFTWETSFTPPDEWFTVPTTINGWNNAECASLALSQVRGSWSYIERAPGCYAHPPENERGDLLVGTDNMLIRVRPFGDDFRAYLVRVESELPRGPTCKNVLSTLSEADSQEQLRRYPILRGEPCDVYENAIIDNVHLDFDSDMIDVLVRLGLHRTWREPFAIDGLISIRYAATPDG